MIIFLYGPDTYRSRQKLKEIISRYQKVHSSGLNLLFLDGATIKFTDLADVFQQSSMFNEKKLVVIFNVANNKEFKDNFLKNYQKFVSDKPTGNLILFYEEGEPATQDKFFTFLKEKTKSQFFPLLSGEKLKNWVKKELMHRQIQIEPLALEKLVNFVGNDLWQMVNEIEKLANYKKGSLIKVADVELLIKPKITTAIFKTIDALAQRNKSQGLYLIHQHLAKGDNALYLLSMITFQFRNLLIIKDLIERQQPYYALAKITGLHPWVLQQTYQQAKKFSLTELKKIYQKILQVDLDIKTGRLDPPTALDLLIAEL